MCAHVETGEINDVRFVFICKQFKWVLMEGVGKKIEKLPEVEHERVNKGGAKNEGG